ncbi:hypothetical protein [Sporosarcina thermotolerans]
MCVIDHFPTEIVHFLEVIDYLAALIGYFPEDIDHFPGFIVIS